MQTYYDIKEIHCPVDLFLINISKQILPYITSKFKDSDIFSLSFILKILSGYTLKLKIKIIPGILFFLSYFLKILYQYYIQKNKKNTHIDNYIYTIVAYAFILHTLYKKNYYVFIIVFILIIPTICNMGCKMKYLKKSYPDSMYNYPMFNDMCTILCPKYIKKHNIFGDGSLVLIISIYLSII
jgi:hypothetical protein